LAALGSASPELGFAGAAIGGLFKPSPADAARAAVDAAWDAGIRYFDTAPHYGLGMSERRLGEALRGRPRAEYVLSTKVGRLLARNPAPTGSDLAAGGFAVPDDLVRVLDYSADGVRRSLEAAAVACVVVGLGSPGHVRSAVDWLTGPAPETSWMQEVATP
jgi:D-threo-aldose 1-dehydrogenase